MLLLDNNLNALPDFLQYGMYIAGEFGFGNADDAHVLDHNLFATSLSSSASASQAKTAPFEQTWRPLGRVTRQHGEMMCRQPCARGKDFLPSTALSATLCFQRTLPYRRSSAVQPPLLSVSRQSYGLKTAKLWVK